jgi:hypothetical protein
MKIIFFYLYFLYFLFFLHEINAIEYTKDVKKVNNKISYINTYVPNPTIQIRKLYKENKDKNNYTINVINTTQIMNIAKKSNDNDEYNIIIKDETTNDLNNTSINFFDCYSFTRMNDYILSVIYYSIVISYIILFIIIKNYHRYFTFLNKDILILRHVFKLGNLLFLCSYILWWNSILFYSFYNTTTSQILSMLGAWISLNLASVFLPITRNSFWVLLLNISYNDIVFTHKVIGVLCFTSILIKFIYCLIQFDSSFFIILIKQSTGGSPIFGLISTISFILCTIVSFHLIRKNWFELFYYSHRILSSFGIIFGTLHYASTFYYILPSILLYIIDIFLRIYFMRSPIYSRIKNVGYNKSSSIFIELSLMKKIKTFPGCYFLICFYSDISKYQWHPLSLITNDKNTLSFCAKDNGGNSWTSKLKNVINEYNILLDSKIYIQGPYGTDFSKYYKNNKYNNIILFCGGIGITPLISIIEDLDLKIKFNNLNILKKINFIWIVNNQYLIKSFEKYFMNLSDKFIINIFITGQDLEYADDINVQFYYKLNIFYYKPSVVSLLTKNLILKKRNCIISCGSSNLIKIIQTYNYRLNNFDTDLYYESFS